MPFHACCSIGYLTWNRNTFEFHRMAPTTTKEKSEFHRHESRQYYKYPWVFALLFRSTNDLNPLQNRLCDLGRRGFATKVRGQHRPLAQHGIHSVLDSSRGLAVAQMAEHHRSGADGSHRVGLVLACYVRCGAVYAVAMGKQELVGGGCRDVRFTHHEFVACIHRGDHPERTDQGSCCVTGVREIGLAYCLMEFTVTHERMSP